MEKIAVSGLSALFAQVGKVMADNAERLCAIDAQMGDGDLGLTMNRGFNALPALLEEMEEPDLGKRLSKAGMKMASVAPSTMGTLMASGMMASGKALTGKSELDAAGYAVYLEAFAEGIRKRGKCEPGDRTVLDAILPAAQRARAALQKDPGAPLETVAREALTGAEDGVAATKTMAPKFGKAVPHTSRAAGVEDQGALAGLLMISGFYEFIRQ